MIDLNHLEQYRENNRIEAKRALGGLPHSIWETYSSFANTLGGIILLGVVEHKDKTLHTVNLPDPEELVSEFWEIVRNPKLTSVNILSANDVRIEEVNGDHIIVITVPRAERFYKPVYVDGSPVNTYRRSGEGDYRCTQEEYQAMVRDASYATQDMQKLEQYDLSVFNFDSVRKYRKRVRKSHPNHVWETLDDGEFLFKIGAVNIGEQGKRHPTAAGLLMFGTAETIKQNYPNYSLDYREADCQIVSSSDDWSGNVFDFYEMVFDRLKLALHDKPVRLAARIASFAALPCATLADEDVQSDRSRRRSRQRNPEYFLHLEAARLERADHQTDCPSESNRISAAADEARRQGDENQARGQKG